MSGSEPTWRDGTTTLGGLHFHFLDWGTPGHPPVLLVHGAAQTAHSWDEVAPDLARDHHALALDLRGHGDSDRAPDGVYRREDLIGDLRGFLDDRGWPAATLIALSLGGLTSIGLAARDPARVRGLVVVDIAPTIERAGASQIHQQVSVHDFGSFDEAVERAMAFNPRRSRANVEDRLRHALRETPDGRWIYKFDGAVFGAAGDLEPLWDEVRRLTCPTLLVRGAESPILAAEVAARFTRELPGATTVEVPGAGHSVMGDNPEGFLAAVRPFLRRHDL